MDEREELARQLHREHREGMAADRLEAERRKFAWDFEGWSPTDDLLLYIAGSGLHRIPADEVVRLANAMLAEHEMRFRDDDGGEWVRSDGQPVTYWDAHGVPHGCGQSAPDDQLITPADIICHYTRDLESTGQMDARWTQMVLDALTAHGYSIVTTDQLRARDKRIIQATADYAQDNEMPVDDWEFNSIIATVDAMEER